MSEVINIPELPKPDALIVPKNNVSLVIDWRKKKAGDDKGTYVPYLPKKDIELSDLATALGADFLITTAVTRFNSALTDWYNDVIEKKGIFSTEEFVKRVMEGKLARLKMDEINEQLEDVLSQLEKITILVDAAGGTESTNGAIVMTREMRNVMKLNNEMVRLNNLKLANKRKRKDSDEDND